MSSLLRVYSRFIWRRFGLFAASEAQVDWSVPAEQTPGWYRIRHFGHYKLFTSKKPRPYKGECRKFKVCQWQEVEKSFYEITMRI